MAAGQRSMAVRTAQVLVLAMALAPSALASRCNFCPRSGGFRPRDVLNALFDLGGGASYIGRKLQATATSPSVPSYGRHLLAADYAQCLDSYNAAGGDAGLVNRAPSCNVSGFNLNACCGEVKSIYNADGFLGCLCNQQVWDYVAGRADTAGIAGVNANSLGTFLSVCGIPSVKSGGC